jgi:hypothetical protein
MTAATAKSQPVTPTAVADSGKIRLGAGWGLLPPAAPASAR